MKFAKHVHVLHLLNQIPKPIGLPDDEYQTNTAVSENEASDIWDEIFTYIHANWAAPQTVRKDAHVDFNYLSCTEEMKCEIAECKVLLKLPHLDFISKLETLPPYFLEALFPVAVGRYLLHDAGLGIDHRKITTFDEFCRRYTTMLLCS